MCTCRQVHLHMCTQISSGLCKANAQNVIYINVVYLKDYEIDLANLYFDLRLECPFDTAVQLAAYNLQGKWFLC